MESGRSYSMLIEEVLSSGSLCCYISHPFITTQAG